MENQYNAVKEKLSGNKDLLIRVANVLLEKETIDGKEFLELVNRQL
ncbi:hypothetical protein FACS1894164_15000 [Spirochaetia bacterium]|nr:hypothetical protein FACS1894164_15000 [Spirochaetia bacterium]